MPGPRMLSPNECDQMDTPDHLQPGPVIIAGDDLVRWGGLWAWFWRF